MLWHLPGRVKHLEDKKAGAHVGLSESEQVGFFIAFSHWQKVLKTSAAIMIGPNYENTSLRKLN